jgi:hypothetical protein
MMIFWDSSVVLGLQPVDAGLYQKKQNQCARDCIQKLLDHTSRLY